MASYPQNLPEHGRGKEAPEIPYILYEKIQMVDFKMNKIFLPAIAFLLTHNLLTNNDLKIIEQLKSQHSENYQLLLGQNKNRKALESIEIVNLSDNKLHELSYESWADLSEALEQCPKLEVLNLSGTICAATAWPEFINLIKKCRNLRKLNLSVNFLGLVSAELWTKFGEALAEPKNLTDIDLSMNALYMLNDNAWIEFLGALSKAQNLTNLSFEKNRLEVVKPFHWPEIANKLSHFPNLETLNINENFQGKKHIEIFEKHEFRPTTSKIETLHRCRSLKDFCIKFCNDNSVFPTPKPENISMISGDNILEQLKNPICLIEKPFFIRQNEWFTDWFCKKPTNKALNNPNTKIEIINSNTFIHL
jgi:hypothetical protein